ncbi:HET-domain-containing protein [Microthyrium microscopicum]|uniref:HET-domain-containing protein n=1 Tax=Microthyrium microscopicum TaxID=703497 RepID=A0A6A6U4W9_9PEZI|nr:HET-domain-containing protein [Microthyrium microscopicum]
MRLLQIDETGRVSLTRNHINNIPPYAILSHTWGSDEDEVTFQELSTGTGTHKVGFTKIRFCGQQAAKDGLQYFWVDTCAIDKSSSTELQESINSMFAWYRNAKKCYVYLTDVPTNTSIPWQTAFHKSRWFTRGWTLQELLAPSSVEFFSKDQRLGDKRSLEQDIHEITGIAVEALQNNDLSSFSVEERMSWTENRNTLREEDKVYSLLGIFGVYMPMLYSEGQNNAFRRLREEIAKNENMSSNHGLLSKRNG